jgi:two-component system cell cycle sensor histidine kinase/response regulator CckA
VKQSGGYVRVRSEQGEGTKFDIYFPRMGSESGDTFADEGAPVAAGERRSAKVLLVEDEQAVRELTRDFLTRAGHIVLEADDCAHAIKICEQLTEPVDLLITDVVMPDMSGPELAARFASLHPDLAVLFVSGYAAESLHQHIADLSNIPLVSKPFTSETLLGEVDKLLSRAELDS